MSSALPIHVLLCDEKASSLGIIREALALWPEVRCVATTSSSEKLQKLIETEDVTVVLICVAAQDHNVLLPRLLKVRKRFPAVRIILYTEKDYALTAALMQALDLGVQGLIFEAFSDSPSALFLHELRRKITQVKSERNNAAAPAAPVSLARRAPSAIAIGASTGGPNAVQTFCETLRGNVPKVPIFITQHMLPDFTTALAVQLTKALGRECCEPLAGQGVTNNSIFLAPGDWHMEVSGMPPSIVLHQGEQENFCRPAVDVMLRSLVARYGQDLLVIIFTGMGQDGLAGCRLARAAGATILVQDEVSSAVWGMPRAVAEAGLADAILPPVEIARAVLALFKGEEGV